MAAITGVPLLGSLRSGSYNRPTLAAAPELVPDGLTLLEAPDLKAIPPLDMDDLETLGAPTSVEIVSRGIDEADAVLFVSPEYNYSVPGVLKNAIDWVSRDPARPFAGKPVGIMGATTGAIGTARMQYHLRQILVYVDALPLGRPEVMIGGAAERFSEGRLVDEPTRELMA